jgi:hypothetical protein
LNFDFPRHLIAEDCHVYAYTGSEINTLPALIPAIRITSNTGWMSEMQ